MKKLIIISMAFLVLPSVYAGYSSRSYSSSRSSFKSSPSRSYSRPRPIYTKPKPVSTPKPVVKATPVVKPVNKKVSTINSTSIAQRTTHVDNSSNGGGLFSLSNLMTGWLIWGNHNTQQKLDTLNNKLDSQPVSTTTYIATSTN